MKPTSILLGVVGLISFLSPASAATRTWDGGGASDNWNNSLNWSGNMTPVPGDDLSFAGAAPLVNTNNFGVGTVFRSLTFSAPGYDIRGNEIELTNTLLVTHGLGLTRFRPGLALSANPVIVVTNSRATLSLESYVDAPTAFVCSNIGSVEGLGAILGGGQIFKQGTGPLELFGNTSVGGLVDVEDGTLSVNAILLNKHINLGQGSIGAMAPTLGGYGTVSSFSASKGTVAPADSLTGILTVNGNAIFQNGTTFRVQLNNATPGSGHDQLKVGNTLSLLGDVNLEIVLGSSFLPIVWQTYRIVDVFSANPVNGTFANLPAHAVTNINGVRLRISYIEGTGNDVTLSVLSADASGVTRTWDGGGADNFWTNRFNWVGDVAPGGADDLVFPPGAARLLSTNNYPSNMVFNSITLSGTGYDLRGNMVIVNSGIRSSHASGLNTVAFPTRFFEEDAGITNTAAGTLILSGRVEPDDIRFTFQVDAGNITVPGILGGDDNKIAKRGAGNLTLGGANTYGGSMTVFDGRLTISHGSALGNPSQIFDCQNCTTVTNTGTLYVSGGITVPEPLMLASTGGGTGGVLVNQEHVNELTGPITLEVETPVGVFGAIGELTLSGTLKGPGGLRKTGPRMLRLEGSAHNTYAGSTWVWEGILRLEKSAPFIVAVPGPLIIGDNIGGPNSDVVVVAETESIANTAAVTIQSSGQLALLASDEIGSLAGDGVVVFAGGDYLHTGANNLSTTFAGVISGGGLGGLAKFGSGTLTLTGPCTHFQSAVLGGGTLVLNNAHNGLVTVWPGSRLRGTGPIGAQLFMAGGTVDAGISPGQLSVSGPILVKDANSIFRFELAGTTPGTGYDQLVVGSGVALSNAVLQVVPTVNFPVGTPFTIMNLTGSGKVTNTFAGLPEGASLSAGGQMFQITYQGGTGNDVVLTRQPTFNFFGLDHVALGQATLSQNALGQLIIGNLGPSGIHGAEIPLGDAGGTYSYGSGLGDGKVEFHVFGTRNGVAHQLITLGWMEMAASNLRFFADSSLAGATGHLVEGFRDGVLVESAVVPTDRNIFSIQFWTNNTVIRIEHEAPAPGRRWWQTKYSWSNPQRIVLGAGSGLPIIDADAVRIRPMPVEQLAQVEPPATLELTGVGLPQITILDEALLYLPKPSHKPYPHHAVGQAQLAAQGGKLHVSNIGDTGRDGVSIEVGNCSDGILALTDPINLQSDGAMLILAGRGIFDGEADRFLGIASLQNERNEVQVIADFAAVGSSRVLVEVFNGNNLVGSAVVSGGQSVATLTPGRTGRLPDVNAVGVVPPDLLPRFRTTGQETLDPLPCYLFAFNGAGTFTLDDGRELEGDVVRLIAVDPDGFIDAITFFDILARSPLDAFAIFHEKPRYHTPSPQNITYKIPGHQKWPDIELTGHGFGDNPNDLNVVAVAGNSNGPITALFRVLSATDNRVTARLLGVHPGAQPGPILVTRGVGTAGAVSGLMAQVPDTRGVWTWQPGGKTAATPTFFNPLVFIPGTSCFYSDPPFQGKLTLTLSGGWPNGSTVSVGVNAHDNQTGIGSFALHAPVMPIPDSASLLQRAQTIANTLQTALQLQQGIATVVTAQQVSPTSVSLTLEVTAGYIDQGFFYVCVTPPPSIDNTIVEIRPGGGIGPDPQPFEILGTGFGIDPDDLSVAVVSGGGAEPWDTGYLIPFRALTTRDTRITARLGPVPPEAVPGPIIVMRGEGTRGNFVPALSNLEPRAATWVWHGLEPASGGPDFDANPGTPPPGTIWFHSDPPSNGVMGVTLSGTWPSNALVSVTVRAHDLETGAGNFDLDSPAIQIIGGGSVQECAEAIADIIRGAFQQQAGLTAGVRVDPTIVRGTARVTVFLPAGGYIDRGGVTICVSPPPPVPTVVDVQPSAGRSGELITITGRDFGTNPDDLIAYVEGRNGVRTLLPIISTSDTEIVAKIGTLQPNAQMGPIVVARGIGIRSFPTFSGTTTFNGIVSWNLIPGLQGIGPELHPFFPNLCDSGFFGYACVVDFSGGLHDGLCLVIEGDTPPNATVKVDYFFDLLTGYSAGSVEFQTSSQMSALQLASAIRFHALNHLYPTVVGLPSLLPDDKALLQFLDLRISPTGVPFSLQGHINVCISSPTPVFGGLHHVAKGQAQLSIDDLARLVVSNLGPSGNDGVRIELGAAQGWSADFTPFKLGHGQRVTVSHFASPDGVSTQRMARTWMEVDDGKTFFSSDWSYVGTDRYVAIIQNELGRGLEWAVFGNNERVAVDNYFPQICNEQATTYGVSTLVDQHWVRFCKTGCDCFGTNCWHEILVCTFPFNSGLLTNILATAVELSLGSLATTSRVAEAVAAEPFLTSLTFSSEHLKSLGRFHQALGRATLEAQANRLRVANFGSDGLDGVAIELDRFANFLSLPQVHAYEIVFEPLAIPTVGNLIISATGGSPGSTSGNGGIVMLQNAGELQISADFSSLGTTQAIIEIYRAGTRVASTLAATPVIRRVSADSRLKRFEVYDYPGDYASRFGGIFEDGGEVVLPDGVHVFGDEFRFLAVGESNLTERISSLKITGVGLDTLTIISETSLDVPLRIERVAGNVRVFWPKPADGFLLQETSTLGGAPIQWTHVPASAYQTNQTDIFIIVPAPSANKFYRLRRP